MCEYYETYAERYAAETFSADMTEQYQRFLPLLSKGAKILDVGSGSGRDACYFENCGFRTTALEPSENLCRELSKVFHGDIVCANIQDYIPSERYDGIWACASLVHLREEEVLAFFEKTGLYLNHNGVIYLSGKTGIPTGQVEDGRYFLEFTMQLVEKILAANKQIRLENLWYTEDVNGRTGFRWMNVIFRIKKSLEEMSLKEKWQLFPIRPTEHQIYWKNWYEEEKTAIQRILPEDVRISHIGSTSVNTIWAKPIIDLLVEIPGEREMAAVKEALISAGYLCMSQSPGRISFNKGYTEEGFAEKVFHLHLRYEGDNDELYFRDYLLEHPDTAMKYQELKLKLWKEFEHDRDAYTNAKTDFIKTYTEKAKRSYSNRYLQNK